MTAPGGVFHLGLRDWYARAGAVFATSCGWSLPAHFGDPRGEHAALRSEAALLERSHRSRFMVTGTDAIDTLAGVFAGHLRELEEGRAMRAVALDGSGVICDLVLIARTGGISYLVSGEPSRRQNTLGRLQAAIQPGFDARVDDRTETTCLLGIAGPAAPSTVGKFLSDDLSSRVQALHCVTFEAHGFRSLAIRASDTGEDGFELMLAPAVAQHLIETLGGGGVCLAGAQAQEVARVEAAIPAYEPDLATGLTPAQADLDVLLDLPGGAAGTILAGVLIDRDGPPAPGTPVTAGGIAAGELRSCVRSFSLDATIGLAVLNQEAALPGAALRIAGSPATIVAKPFFRRRSAS
jgi:glycine cleavage system aminomethyltransferase T